MRDVFKSSIREINMNEQESDLIVLTIKVIGVNLKKSFLLLNGKKDVFIKLNLWVMLIFLI